MTVRSQASVGAFVLGGAILLVGTAALFGKLHLFSRIDHAVVVFEGSISGLAIGAPVTFRGVHIGAVEKIDVQYDAKTRVAVIPVTIQIEPGRIQVKDADGTGALTMPGVVARGLRAELNLQSFVTGQSQIDLEIDPGSPAVLHPGATALLEIPTRKSTVEKVKDQLSQLPLQELAANANATLKSLRGLAERLETGLPPLLASVKGITDRSGTALDTATTVVMELQGRLDTALGSINQLATDADRQLGQRGTELHTLLASSNQTIMQARDVLAEFKGITSDRGATRADFDSTLRDLSAAAASLRGFAREVERNPQLLLTGRKP